MNEAPTIDIFKRILGEQNVATEYNQTKFYRKGWRSGEGDALAILFPQTLIQYWEVLKICVAKRYIIIMQAANTGLTEGSTPSGNDYDRPVIVINTLAMNDLILINEGKQVISFPGATIHQLEQLLKPHNRSPHSVIGSSCLGASIVGGVANNSGGALVKRGPAYTELSVFAQVDSLGNLHLVNHLGVYLGDSPEEILANLSSGNFPDTLATTDKKASATDYETLLRDIHADSPSRYNADPSRLYEASGCAGKIAVFAVRLDTFSIPAQEQTYYIGTNDPSVLTDIRRRILTEFTHLPEVGEYLHRDVFDIADKYGKDTILSIRHLGTKALPKLFAMKSRIDARLKSIPFIPPFVSDKLMQWGSGLFPDQIPPRLRQCRDKYEHHLILKMSDEGIMEANTLLSQLFEAEKKAGEFITCNADETERAFLLRFAAAGAAMRFKTMHDNKLGDILALDIALKRNEQKWVESLPEYISKDIEKSLYYGHFFCHVFHQDYILKKGSNAKKVKQAMLALLDERGAKYPAEHNVGHLYEAEDTLVSFYHELDPTNTFNPGIGGTSKHSRNCACC
ncbi:D-lactate dehydrogenase [Alteromonas sp. D210916BOD_24]|uniref:D-lactate dehydrogenase n=1 Tax=Alteromonas sp. D210916BOD_24 TaxID=3157618 RepID=UPI00399D0C72